MLVPKNVWYNLAMVNKPHQTFRRSFATAFEIRSLQDVLQESDTWAMNDAFVDIYYNGEEPNTSDMTEEKVLSRLYNRGTQILKCIHSKTGFITWI